MTSLADTISPIDVSGDKMHEAMPLGPEGVLHGHLDNGLQCVPPRSFDERKVACRCPLAHALSAIHYSLVFGSVATGDTSRQRVERCTAPVEAAAVEAAGTQTSRQRLRCPCMMLCSALAY